MDLNGFQLLQAEHALDQGPGHRIYFSPLIVSIQSYRVLPSQKKKKKKKNLASVLLVTTRYITRAELT